jgi:hypothetical protein
MEARQPAAPTLMRALLDPPTLARRPAGRHQRRAANRPSVLWVSHLGGLTRSPRQLASATMAGPTPPERPVILVEFNELCPPLIKRFMEAGLLPNFRLSFAKTASGSPGVHPSGLTGSRRCRLVRGRGCPRRPAWPGGTRFSRDHGGRARRMRGTGVVRRWRGRLAGV